MKLRVAKKVYAAIGTPDGERYRESTADAALRRVGKTREQREARRKSDSLLREAHSTVEGAGFLFDLAMTDFASQAPAGRNGGAACC